MTCAAIRELKNEWHSDLILEWGTALKKSSRREHGIKVPGKFTAQ